MHIGICEPEKFSILFLIVNNAISIPSIINPFSVCFDSISVRYKLILNSILEGSKIPSSIIILFNKVLPITDINAADTPCPVQSTIAIIFTSLMFLYQIKSPPTISFGMDNRNELGKTVFKSLWDGNNDD